MKKILIISIILTLMPVSVLAVYHYHDFTNASAIIAEPIVIVENLSERETVDFYKNTVKEYEFIVKNYVKNSYGTRIGEVSFNYYIEIHSSSPNFPTKYELYNSNNEDILNRKQSYDKHIYRKK